MRIYKTNSLAATQQFLQQFGINYDRLSLKSDLLSHPDYPSLLSVHWTLSKYGLANTPLEIDKSHLSSIRNPFLAYMKLPETGTDFALVNNVSYGNVVYTNLGGRKVTISQDEFISLWKNIVVVADNGTIYSPNPRKKSRKRLRVGILTCLILLPFVLITLGAALPLLFLPWLILKCAGVVITILLLLYELDKDNTTVKQFCTTERSTSCDSVLNSAGAKIGSFSWSELGFSYFTGTLLYLTIARNSLNAYVPLAIFSLFSFFYSIYSIYYQYKVVRQWCRLCLATQAIVILEAILIATTILTGNITWPSVINWQMSLLLIFIMPLPLLVWLSLKNILKNGMLLDNYQYAYLRLLNNPDVFNLILHKQNPLYPGYKECSLLIGDEAAENEIVKVCNPFCGPCSSAHSLIEEIIANEKNIKLRIMFVTTGNKVEQKKQASSHFINLYLSEGQTNAQKAMHYWYTNPDKDIEKLRELFPSAEQKESALLLEEMKLWQKDAGITYTPTIFVNGFLLPQDYTLENLKQIL